MLTFLLLACDTSPSTSPPGKDDTGATDDSGDTSDSADTSDTGGDTGDSTGDTDTVDTADTAVDPGPVQVYLLAGQSNMDGYAYVTGLPPSLQVSQGDVRLYWSGNGSWTGLAPASYGIDYGVEYFGPEVTFGRFLADQDEAPPVALIKHAIGGTDLAYYWYPGEYRRDPAQGLGYRDFLATIELALAELDAEGTAWEIAGMIWMQGESDAYSDEDIAAAYEANLTHFISRVRDDVGAPDLPFVIGKIHCPTCPYGDIVRAGEDAVDAADPKVTAFATEDLSVNADGIHYDGAAMRTLGERFAESLLGLPMSASAQPAFQITGSYASSFSGDFFLGYTFDLRRPVTVTDLGTLDFGLTGLVYPSTVALFDAETTNLLARVTVPAYYTAPTEPWGMFRFAAIEAVDLEPGRYVIASQVFNGSEDIYLYDVGITAASGFDWVEGRHKDYTAVAFPATVSSAPANWVGPNLLFLER